MIFKAREYEYGRDIAHRYSVQGGGMLRIRLVRLRNLVKSTLHDTNDLHWPIFQCVKDDKIMTVSKTDTITEEPVNEEVHFEKLVAPQAAPRKYEVVKFNLMTFGYGHIAALYGLYLLCTVATWKTVIFHCIIFIISTLGITAGSHRLWTHKAYKAKRPLQIILMIMSTFAFQNTVVDWVRDHRMHHKYSDTDADPYNPTRGFFFAHIGWMLVRKHEEVKKRGKFLDMSDIYANPVLMFQRRYAIPFIGTVCFLLPTVIPMYFFGETLNTAWHITVLRYFINLHCAFSVNSVAHLYGTKPYDKTIKPTQSSWVSLLVFGEGFHNYHHVFPWDYKTAELGNSALNFTTLFIDFFAWLGWAYDLKTASDAMIKARSERTGDGKNIWGF
ncbi:acyl-CoA Delta(11) desaturase-like [Melitaea cinxia]|uniref:acyl-CoA Delta(11) desaturase-like n=1 Tax=Melitaea cinxia TaxID=113334 RepID=UPI001E2723A9|nr:acyl-CoA Delta(11) desaturase-like [Melitaea cinxia]